MTKCTKRRFGRTAERLRLGWGLVAVGLATLVVGPVWARPYRPPKRRTPRYGRRGKRPNNRRGPDDRNQPTRGNPATKTLLDSGQEFNECRRFPRHKRVKITLKPDSELHDLIAWISGMTCKRFIVGSNVRAQKVTIYSPTPVTALDAYRAFLSALNVMGLTVVPAGRYLKVVETRNRTLSSLCTPGHACPADDRILTRLIRLKYVKPSEVKSVVDSLKSRDGNVVTYDNSGLLIITDVARVISRLVRVIRYLDEPSQGNRIWVIRLKNADPSDMSQKIQDLFGAKSGRGGKGGVRSIKRRPSFVRGKSRSKSTGASAEVGTGISVSKVLADDRTRTLIIVADERSYLRVLALVHKLDIAVKGGEEKIHVVSLFNADAEDMAATLSGITGGSSGRSSRRGRSSRSRRKTTRRRTGRSSGAAMAGLFEGDVQVTPDKPTNSLVVVASLRDFLSLKKVIDRLDQPRRQVYVEATIMEVSLSKTRDLGLAFHGGKPVGSGDKRSLLLFGNNAAKSITLDPASLMGLAIGLRGPELKDAESLLGIPGISFPTFGVFFQALQSNNDVNVISTPHILTTDNEEAVIEVGENVPFQSGITGLSGMGGFGASGANGSAGGGFGAYPMMSIQRQDVTLKLKIVPHVNDSNFVRLEIEQEMNEVKSIDPVVGPTTSKKKIKTMIVLRDQQTAVLGGLITEKSKQNVTKIPLLGDIPILGYLFKTTKTIKEKSNLLIFLTPYIIRDQDDLRRIFRRKMEQRRDFLERYTAFKDEDLDAVIDYRHKRGLLAEINVEAHNAEIDEAMKRKAMAESKELDVDGPVVVRPEDRAFVDHALGRQPPEARPSGNGTGGSARHPSKRKPREAGRRSHRRSARRGR
ncbi:MAG: type II secretion system secretin GspD [Deltaproteobacteria bacterium]|nr:type II secretion system secretin GspD [Deltaproteobacteria bacterium]